jgi:hypothetical protein
MLKQNHHDLKRKWGQISIQSPTTACGRMNTWHHAPIVFFPETVSNVLERRQLQRHAWWEGEVNNSNLRTCEKCSHNFKIHIFCLIQTSHMRHFLSLICKYRVLLSHNRSVWEITVTMKKSIYIFWWIYKLFAPMNKKKWFLETRFNFPAWCMSLSICGSRVERIFFYAVF